MNKPKIEVKAKADLISDYKGNNVVVSRQEVIQENGSSTEHIVIEKYKTSSTGVPNGKRTTIWIPTPLVDDVLKAVKSLGK